MERELVLNFHGIGTPHAGVGPQERAVWMSREHFVHLLDYIVQRRAADTAVAITFDDGNVSDVEIALPELLRRKLTATFFVCAGRLGAPGYLSPGAVRDLLGAGMAVGSHGMHHRDWRKLDDAALAEEIGAARKRLADACGRPVVAAAIPFGSYDRRVLAKVRAEGFASVYTSDGGFARRDAWLKPRNTLGQASRQENITRLLAGMPMPQAILDGARRLYKRLR